MRRKIMVLAGVLAMTVSAAIPLQAAQAEPAGGKGGILDAITGENGIVDQLFGDDGLLEGKLPEREELEGMLQTLKEQLGKADSEIDRLAGSILEKAKEKYASFDLDSLKEVLTPLLGKLLGDEADLAGLGELGSFDVGKGLEQNIMARELATAYTLERNADILEAGDVQIVDVSNVYGDEIGLSEEFPYLTYVLQYNYTVDEENPHQLRYLSDGGTLLLMTLHEEEDGSLTSLDTLRTVLSASSELNSK